MFLCRVNKIMGFFHFNSFRLFVYYCMMKRLSMPTAHWVLPLSWSKKLPS